MVVSGSFDVSDGLSVIPRLASEVTPMLRTLLSFIGMFRGGNLEKNKLKFSSVGVALWNTIRSARESKQFNKVYNVNKTKRKCQIRTQKTQIRTTTYSAKGKRVNEADFEGRVFSNKSGRTIIFY